MAPETEVALRKAIAHIRAGKASRAQPILVGLLRVEPNNAQAWYLLSYVLDDPQRQQYALLQALRISPEFDKARKRLQKLRGEAIETEIAIQEPLPVDAREETVKPAPAFFEESTKTEEEIRPQETASESELTEEPPATKSPRRTLLFALLVIIVAVLAYFAVTMYIPVVNVATRASATPIASQTLPATWTPSIQATQTSTRTLQPTFTATIEPTLTPSTEGSATP